MEQTSFGRHIALPGAMPVKVLMGDIGHHRYIVFGPGYARLVEGMRGCFDYGCGAPGRYHLREVALQIEGDGSGDMVAGLEDLATDEGRDGGDETRLHTRGGQDAL